VQGPWKHGRLPIHDHDPNEERLQADVVQEHVREVLGRSAARLDIKKTRSH
jgi:hypothetical protein